jgi:hypothetical protein
MRLVAEADGRGHGLAINHEFRTADRRGARRAEVRRLPRISRGWRIQRSARGTIFKSELFPRIEPTGQHTQVPESENLQ